VSHESVPRLRITLDMAVLLRTMNTMKTRAIGYVRVSDEEQATEGMSLQAQRAKLEAYAMLQDLDLVAVLADEGISGKRADNRPALQEALLVQPVEGRHERGVGRVGSSEVRARCCSASFTYHAARMDASPP